MSTELTINQQKLVNFIRLNPGCTSNQVADAMEMSNPSAWYSLNTLVERGYAHRQESRSEANRLEYKYYLGKVSTASQTSEKNEEESHITQSVADALRGTGTLEQKPKVENSPKQKPSLSDYTPRELMVELKRRGYTGKLKLITIREVDFERL